AGFLSTVLLFHIRQPALYRFAPASSLIHSLKNPFPPWPLSLQLQPSAADVRIDRDFLFFALIDFVKNSIAPFFLLPHLPDIPGRLFYLSTMYFLPSTYLQSSSFLHRWQFPCLF